MRMPRPGENVLLMCQKCHNSFNGPCPDRSGLCEILNRIIKKAKCPKCGSYKVILNPMVRY
jgi:hypothetical protein